MSCPVRVNCTLRGFITSLRHPHDRSTVFPVSCARRTRACFATSPRLGYVARRAEKKYKERKEQEASLAGYRPVRAKKEHSPHEQRQTPLVQHRTRVVGVSQARKTRATSSEPEPVENGIVKRAHLSLEDILSDSARHKNLFVSSSHDNIRQGKLPPPKVSASASPSIRTKAIKLDKVTSTVETHNEGFRLGKRKKPLSKDPYKSSSASKSPRSPERPGHLRVDKDAWQIQKEGLRKKFGDGKWMPRKRLSPDTVDGIRALHSQNPDAYTTPFLAEQFKVSPDAVRRILKSKWRPTEEEEEERRLRWEKRGETIWSQMAEKGIKPPRKWRAKGIRVSREDASIPFEGFSSNPAMRDRKKLERSWNGAGHRISLSHKIL